VGTFPIELGPEQPGAASRSLSPKDFFDLLSTTTVRLLNHLTHDVAA
jgi:hypothetical protein